MAEDKIAAPHAVEEGKNARVLDLQNDTGNATISLTEFAKLEKIVPLKQ